VSFCNELFIQFVIICHSPASVLCYCCRFAVHWWRSRIFCICREISVCSDSAHHFCNL